MTWPAPTLPKIFEQTRRLLAEATRRDRRLVVETGRYTGSKGSRMSWARLDDRWHDHPQGHRRWVGSRWALAYLPHMAHQHRRSSATPGVVSEAVVARFETIQVPTLLVDSRLGATC
jgi:hypothetical protein